MGINIENKSINTSEEVCIDSFYIGLPIKDIKKEIETEPEFKVDNSYVEESSTVYSTDMYKRIKESLNLEGLKKDQVSFVLNNSSTWIEERVLYGVSAAVSAAQGILESGWGTSKLAKKYNAYYGVKFSSKSNLLYLANGESVKYHDNYEGHSSKYVSFESHWYSIRHHTKVLVEFYPNLIFKDWKYSVQHLEDKGYATTANYCTRDGCKNGHYNANWKKQKRKSPYFGKESRSEVCKEKGCKASYSSKLEIGAKIYAEKLTNIIKKYKLYTLDDIAKDYLKK